MNSGNKRFFPPITKYMIDSFLDCKGRKFIFFIFQNFFGKLKNETLLLDLKTGKKLKRHHSILLKPLTRSLPRQISCASFMLPPIRFKFLAVRHGNFMAFHLLCQILFCILDMIFQWLP